MYKTYSKPKNINKPTYQTYSKPKSTVKTYPTYHKPKSVKYNHTPKNVYTKPKSVQRPIKTTPKKIQHTRPVSVKRPR